MLLPQAWRQKSSHNWGDSPSDILDAIAVIAPGFMQGPPLPGVLQAMEDLERPLRGEIMVDIKRVLDAEANRIKVIRDRRVSDSETLKNVVLSALFALFTFLGQFLVRAQLSRCASMEKNAVLMPHWQHCGITWRCLRFRVALAPRSDLCPRLSWFVPTQYDISGLRAWVEDFNGSD